MNPYGNNDHKKQKEEKARRERERREQKALEKSSNPFANIQIGQATFESTSKELIEGKKSKNKGNKSNNNAKPPVIFLKDLTLRERPKGEEKSQADKDKDKLKKALLPQLTFITENDVVGLLNKHTNKEHLSKQELAQLKSFEENVYIIIKKIYDEFSAEYKNEFLGFPKDHAIQTQEEHTKLREKYPRILKEALSLSASFRNFAMHKSMKEDPFTSFKFDSFDGDLINLLRLSAQKERVHLKAQLAEFPDNKFAKDQLEYWDAVLSSTPDVCKETKNKIPFVYVLAAMSLVIEAKEMQELLTLTRYPKFTTTWVLQFSLRGGFKVISPGFFQEDKSLDLYRIQINSRESVQGSIHTNRRIIHTYKQFTNDDKPKPDLIPAEKGVHYQKLLRFHGFTNSYPTILEFKDTIKHRVATEISEARKERIENIKADNLDSTKTRRPVPTLELDVDKIKKEFTNIFRTDDVFMREAMAFLEEHDSHWFGGNWRIVGNAVIWYEPLKQLEFDIRRKTKPSRNAVKSIYKLRYDKNAKGKTISLGRTNLQSLVATILLGHQVDFEKLRETATVLNNNQKKEAQSNDNPLWKKLSEECGEWNRYQQAQIVSKFMRKFMNRLHLNDSISLHKEMMMDLYLFDNQPSDIRKKIPNYFERQGNPYPNEVKEIFESSSTLEGLCASTCLAFEKLNIPKKSGEKTATPFYTWKKGDFSPASKNQPIHKILGWEDTDNALFDILYQYIEQEKIKQPRIIEVYKQQRPEGVGKKSISKRFNTDKKGFFRELEIRTILCDELLFPLMAREYRRKIAESHEYIELVESTNAKEYYSPVDCDVVWNLNPKIQTSFEDSNKKDIKMSLNWIFDPRRISGIKSHEDLDPSDDKAIAQKCLDMLINANDLIAAHPTLKSKAPKYTKHNGDFGIDDIKILVKRAVWAQKEMLSFLCDIERQLIYELSQKNSLPKMEEEGYYNFASLITSAIKGGVLPNNPKMWSLIGVRNMMAHGKLHDYSVDLQKNVHITEFKQVFPIINEALKTLGRNDFDAHYNKKKPGNKGNKNSYSDKNTNIDKGFEEDFTKTMLGDK